MRTVIVSFVASFVILSGDASAAKYCTPEYPDDAYYEEEGLKTVGVARVPVRFNDSSGRRTARIIAQERAVGSIVRWFERNQTTIRSVTTSSGGAETAMSLQDENGVTSSKSYTREETQALKEMEASISSRQLSGILQVEEYFDDEMMEMCVTMGFSAKSVQAAQKSRELMDGEMASDGLDEEQANDDGTSSYTRSRGDDW